MWPDNLVSTIEIDIIENTCKIDIEIVPNNPIEIELATHVSY